MPKEREETTGRESVGARKLRVILRKLFPDRYEGALWKLLDGQGNARADVEVYQGVGFHGLPPGSSETVEAIVGQVGASSDHPVCLAARDEGMRRAHAEIADMDGASSGAAAMFNQDAYVHVHEDGSVRIRVKAGAKIYLTDENGGTGGAVQLALKSDVDDLASWIDGNLTSHVHAGVTTGGGTSGTNTPPVPPSPPTASGTDVVRGK